MILIQLAKFFGGQNPPHLAGQFKAVGVGCAAEAKQIDKIQFFHEANSRFSLSPPNSANMPPIKAKAINIATNVPPRIAPAMAQNINNMPGNLPFALMQTEPNTMVRNDNTTPPQPRPITIEAFSASTAPAIPSTNKVTPAAITANIPAIKAINPPAFFINILPKVGLLHQHDLTTDANQSAAKFDIPNNLPKIKKLEVT